MILALWLVVFINLADASFSALAMAVRNYNFVNKSLTFQSIALFSSACLIPIVGSSLMPSIGLRVLGASLFCIWFIVTLLRVLQFERIRVCWLTLRAQLLFGSKNWLQNIIGFLNLRCYFLILAIYSDPKVVGFFSVAWIFVELIRFFPDAIGTMLLPELTSKKSYNEQVLYTAKSMRLLLIIISLISALVYFLLDFFLPLIFGQEYFPAIIITKLLLIGTTLGVVYQVLTRFFTSQDKQKYSLVSALIGLLSGLTCSVILIPTHAAFGAALAFNVGALFTSIFAIFFFCYDCNLKFTEVFKFQFSDFFLR